MTTHHDIEDGMEELEFLPSLTKYYDAFQEGVFNVAKQQIEGYSGGKWTFTRTPDGGYMWPDGEEPLTLNSMNGNTVTVTPRAAGVAITMLVANHLSWRLAEQDRPEGMRLDKLYFDLRNYTYGDDSPFSSDDIKGIYSYLD